MPTCEERIEVGVPVRTAYDRWTQFEEFLRFMGGVEGERTALRLRIDFQPDDATERGGDALGAIERRVRRDDPSEEAESA
jgi:hypothetical protein